MTDRCAYGLGIVISVAVTFAPEAFDAQGDYTNGAQTLFSRIAAELAPDDAPPGAAVIMAG